MIDLIAQLDIDLTLFLNGLGNSFWDPIMIFLSNKYVWIPLYALLVFHIYQQYPHNWYWIVLGCILVIVIADQTTSSLMKPYLERLRPCRDERFLNIIRIPSKCGGKYGFASSHAANTMGLAFYFFLWQRIKHNYLLIIWAILISISRVYLGAHYLGDVIVGGIIGILSAWIIFQCVSKLFNYKTTTG